MASGRVNRSRGKWRARWSEHPGGPEHSKSFDRKVDAERYLAETIADIGRGVYFDPRAGEITFREWAEEWRARQQHRPSTATLVEGHLRNHVYPVIGDRPLATIRPSQIEALVGGLTQDLAASTVETVYRYVAAVFGAAVRDRLIPSTPCDRIRLPKVTATKVTPLEVSEVLAIAGALDDRYRALVMLAAGTGMRQGECFGLTIDRVDFLRKRITVDRQRNTVAESEELFGPLKTPASDRVIPIADSTVFELSEHLRKYETGPEGLIFTTEGGLPMQRNRFGDLWRGMRRRSDDVPDRAKFHDLRHFYASLLIREGESVKVVQARLGHASASETLDTYSHLWPDSEDKTRSAVDAVLGSIWGQSGDEAIL